MTVQKTAANPSRQLTAAICVVLAVVVLAVYAQTFRYDFVEYDDNQFVYKNEMVKSGLSRTSVMWALTTAGAYASWQPLTTLSYMADVQFFGLSPGVEHAVNVLVHVANTVLLFLVLLEI